MVIQIQFRLDHYASELRNTAVGLVEHRTLHFTPVCGHTLGTIQELNQPLWDGEVSWGLQIRGLTPDSWKLFELGKTYHLDLTPAT